jgi:hypothetical protein
LIDNSFDKLNEEQKLDACIQYLTGMLEFIVEGPQIASSEQEINLMRWLIMRLENE